MRVTVGDSGLCQKNNNTCQKRTSLSFSADVTLVNLMYLAFPRMAGEDDLRPIRSLLLCPLSHRWCLLGAIASLCLLIVLGVDKPDIHSSFFFSDERQAIV